MKLVFIALALFCLVTAQDSFAKNPENSPSYIVVPLGALTTDQTIKAMKLTKPLIIGSVWVIDPTGVAANASNYVRLNLQQGSTVLASYSTEPSAEGALAANVWKDASEKQRRATSADLDIVVDVNGTGALTAGSKLQIEVY